MSRPEFRSDDCHVIQFAKDQEIRDSRVSSLWVNGFPNPSIRFLLPDICCDSEKAFLDFRLLFR